MKKRNFACLFLLASTTLVACGGSGFTETSKEKFLEVVEKDSKKEITYKSAKQVTTLKKFETKVPAEMLTAMNMTQEDFDNKLLEEMKLEIGKDIEQTIEGNELEALRFTVEDVSDAPEGTKYYVSGDKFKIDTTMEIEGQKINSKGEFNEYGYPTYVYTDTSMTMSIGYDISMSMVTETKVSYTK